MLDSAVRANRKHMISIQSAVSKIELREPDKPQPPPAESPVSPQSALEQGNSHCCPMKAFFIPLYYQCRCYSYECGTSDTFERCFSFS